MASGSAGGGWLLRRKKPKVEDKQQPFDEDPMLLEQWSHSRRREEGWQVWVGERWLAEKIWLPGWSRGIVEGGDRGGQGSNAVGGGGDGWISRL